MTTMSANLSPFLTFVETASAGVANPSAGDQKLIVDTDHVLKLKNSSGTVTPVGGSVGTGNAGAVLAMGNGAAIWNAGTAFPGSKATNDRYWRTDLEMEFYWDGTRWLSTQLFYALGTSGATALSASQVIGTATTWGATYDSWIIELRVSYYGYATQDGSNYWTYDVINEGGSSILGVAAPNSTVQAAWTHSITALGSSRSDVLWQFNCAKTSSAGNTICAMRLSYRMIAT